MDSKDPSRRRFLEAALAGIAVTAIPAVGQPDSPAQNQDMPGMAMSAPGSVQIPKDWHPYGERSEFVTTARIPETEYDNDPLNRSRGLLTPLQDARGTITPSSLHFATTHGYHPPKIDPREHKLMIHGMVNRPLIFTMDELKRFPSVSKVYVLECSANTHGGGWRRPEATIAQSHGRSACSEWTGVLLSVLLKQAGVQDGAKWLVMEGSEASKMAMNMPMAQATKDVMVAYGQNGEPVRPENGFPLRLIVPGAPAISSVKWLRRIKVTDQQYVVYQHVGDYTGFDPATEWPTLEPKSVITFPSGGQRLSDHGSYEISGLAWSGGSPIRKVEVSVDGGKTWKEAAIKGDAHPSAFTQFGFEWKWNGEEALLQSRCTDDRGKVQPTMAQFAKTFNVTIEEMKKGNLGSTHHANFVYTWKVSADGSVQNAPFA